MIVFNATFLVTPGQEEQVRKILLTHVEEAKTEPGVLITRVYRSRSEPRRFFIYHELSDPDAFDLHRATRHYGGHILTDLYSMLELDSLLIDAYEQLTPTASPSLEISSGEESEP
jgi:quinol monooxygenase YgiN